MLATKPAPETVAQPKSEVVSVSSLDALRALPPEAKEAAFEGRSFRRHCNPNGTVGGFVESTAAAAKDVIINSKSLVLENAMVCGIARLDNATVTGNAHVSEGARLKDGIEIGGNTKVMSDIHGDTFGFEYGFSWLLFKADSLGGRKPEAKQLLRSEVADQSDIEKRTRFAQKMADRKARIYGLLERIYKETGNKEKPDFELSPKTYHSGGLIFTINLRRCALNVELEDAFLGAAKDFGFTPMVIHEDLNSVPKYKLTDDDGRIITLEPGIN